MKALFIALVLLFTGCASQTHWPAISDSTSRISTPGRWVWGELFSDDCQAAKEFYGKVFDWQFEQFGSGQDAYTLIKANDRPIAGIIHYPKAAEEAKRSARWLGLLSVSDVSLALSQAKSGGGQVIMPAKQFKGRGNIALLVDPEGAFFGVIRAETGDPIDTLASENSWLWYELWAHDASKMADFYKEIGNYSLHESDSGIDRKEMHLMADGYPRAGIVEFKRGDLPSTWLPYVRVKNLQETVKRVEKAGGRIFVSPSPEIRQGRVAVFIDPQGAAVGLAEWSDEIEEGKK